MLRQNVISTVKKIFVVDENW